MQTEFVNGTQRTTDWQSVNWRKANRIVKNLRQRIFRATRCEDWKRVRNLQRLLLKSYSNVLIAVRRVTQINAGKNTPGIDKMLGLCCMNQEKTDFSLHPTSIKLQL